MFFTIIVPVFNVAPYVRACLDSFVNQTFGDWECICVDDGSSDGSGGILDGYRARDERFVVVHKENGGVSSARNAALDIARGDWILYCDADDALIPESLEYLHVQILERPDLDMLGFGYTTVSHQDAQVPFVAMPTSDFVATDEKLSALMFVKLFTKFGGAGACFRRASLGSVRFRNLIQAEDILYGTECLLQARHVAKSYTTLYLYYQREGSCVHTRSVARYLSRLQFMRELLDLVNEWRCKDGVRSFIKKFVWNNFARRIAEMQKDVFVFELNAAWEGVFSKGEQIFCRGWPYGTFARFCYRILFASNSKAVLLLFFLVPLNLKKSLKRLLALD